MRNFRPREGNTRTDRLSFPVLDSHAQPGVRAGRSPISSPETKSARPSAVCPASSPMRADLGWSSFRVPAPGRYRIRVKGYTIWVSGGGVDHRNYVKFGPEKGSLPLSDDLPPAESRRSMARPPEQNQSAFTRKALRPVPPVGGVRLHTRSLRAGSGGPSQSERSDPDRSDAPVPNPRQRRVRKNT